jgi:hypothetical protein
MLHLFRCRGVAEFTDELHCSSLLRRTGIQHKNYWKYFTVAVNNIGSHNMNVAITNDRLAILIINILHTLRWTHPQMKCTVRNPQVYAHVTWQSVTNRCESLQSMLVAVILVAYNQSQIINWRKFKERTTCYNTQGRYSKQEIIRMAQHGELYKTKLPQLTRRTTNDDKFYETK